MPTTAFGRGFMTSKVKSSSSPVYPVDPKNGMPIVTHKKLMSDKQILRKNNMVNGDLAAKGD
jgi:hypothetical protein